jgi:hypothetical protein
METLKAELARLFAAKEARRRKLARLPFPEKASGGAPAGNGRAGISRARQNRARMGAGGRANE